MPAGFPRWRNGADGAGEPCAVCEDEVWVPMTDAGGYEATAPCRWCDKGYEYVEAQLLLHNKRFPLYELSDVIGLRDEQRELVEQRAAQVEA